VFSQVGVQCRINVVRRLAGTQDDVRQPERQQTWVPTHKHARRDVR
jgi:hypothetical protein